MLTTHMLTTQQPQHKIKNILHTICVEIVKFTYKITDNVSLNPTIPPEVPEVTVSSAKCGIFAVFPTLLFCFPNGRLWRWVQTCTCNVEGINKILKCRTHLS